MANVDVIEKIYSPIISLLEKEIEKGVAPWRRMWDVSSCPPSMPTSGATGSPYRGANAMILSLIQGFAGYPSGEWFTYKGAVKAGAPVRKGEKGVHIFSPPFQIKEINEETNEERIVGIAYRSFVVFNRAQCGEVEESSSAPEEMEPPVFAGESRILNYFQEDLKMKINIQKQDSAFYRPSDDSITMPTPAQFEGWESFDGTLLHEAAHWTKAPNRLDRNHPYAKEELVAELASTFGAYRLGIKCDFPNSASYLNGWLSAMKKDPSFLHKCVQDSVKAIEYLFPELKEKYE